jgi:outer membrane immunogenic protein
MSVQRRVSTLLAAGSIFGASATIALAADLPSSNPYYDNSVSSAVYDWTGPYVGAHVGYGWGSADAIDMSGFVGGVQGGYNIQSNQFVMGLEGDIGLANIDKTSGSTRASIDTLGSVRARAGFAFDQFLVYGTGGFSFGDFSYKNSVSRDDRWHLGWVLGVGAEAALTRNWTARVEAFYYDLGSKDYLIAGGHDSISVDATVVRAGLNYRF